VSPCSVMWYQTSGDINYRYILTTCNSYDILLGLSDGLSAVLWMVLNDRLLWSWMIFLGLLCGYPAEMWLSAFYVVFYDFLHASFAVYSMTIHGAGNRNKFIIMACEE